VNCSYDFFFTRLEESKFNVREGYINNLTFHRTVPESIQVTLKISFGFLLPNAWSGIQVTKDRSLSFVNVNLFLFNYILFSMLFTELDTNFFLKSLHLPFQLSHSINLLTSKDNFFHKNDRLSIFREIYSRYTVG